MIEHTLLLTPAIKGTSTIKTVQTTNASSCIEVDEFYDVEWIGNHMQWIGGLKYQNTAALRRQFRGKKLLFIGDSLTRRFSYTLKALLDGDLSHKALDYDRRGYDGHGRVNMSSGSVDIDFRWTPLLDDVTKLLTQNPSVTQEVDLTVISVGVHDAFTAFANPANFRAKKTKGSLRKGNETVQKSLHGMMGALRRNLLSQHVGDTGKVMLRLMPPPAFSDCFGDAVLEDISEGILRELPEGIQALDTRRIIQSRAQGDERIRGNTKFHYGEEARIAFVQAFARFQQVRSTCHDDNI